MNVALAAITTEAVAVMPPPEMTISGNAYMNSAALITSPSTRGAVDAHKEEQP
jgi:hypothetical protein